MIKQKIPLLRQLIIFGIIVVLLAGLLSILNWLPNLINPHRMKRFSSVDAAKKELHAGRLYLPTYMPEDLHLSWPPADVFAQDEPFGAVIMHFTTKGSRDIGLVIQQTGKNASYAFDPAITVTDKKAALSIFVKGRQAALSQAVCDAGTPCHIIFWQEGDTLITLTGKVPAREIIKIAASMLPGDY